jgi:D-ribose pyranase
MLKTGILNPQILSLLARVRHTNLLVIADRGFPFWPEVETVDISLVDGIPSVLQVLRAVLPNFDCGQIWMAQEFLDHNATETHTLFRQAVGTIRLQFEPHLEFKQRVPQAIGLIRTGDTLQYANMILVSGPVQ